MSTQLIETPTSAFVADAAAVIIGHLHCSEKFAVHADDQQNVAHCAVEGRMYHRSMCLINARNFKKCKKLMYIVFDFSSRKSRTLCLLHVHCRALFFLFLAYSGLVYAAGRKKKKTKKKH